MRNYFSLTMLAVAFVTAIAGAPTAFAAGPVVKTPTVNIKVFVNSGLINPRGLHFGPDNNL